MVCLSLQPLPTLLSFYFYYKLCVSQLKQSALKATKIVQLKLVFLSVQYSLSCNPCNWN